MTSFPLLLKRLHFHFDSDLITCSWSHSTYVMKILELPEIDQVSNQYSIGFVINKDHTLCLHLIMLRPILSPIHILNSLIIPALTIFLSHSLWPTSSSQSPSMCLSRWKKCLAQVFASPSWLQLDSWLHSCLVEFFLCVFFGICELGVACTQFWFALLWVLCVVWVDGLGNVLL
jgi:hypothetical protein